MHGFFASTLSIAVLLAACVSDDTTIRPNTAAGSGGAQSYAAGSGAVASARAGSAATPPTAAGAPAPTMPPPINPSPSNTPRQPTAAAGAPAAPPPTNNPGTTAPPAPSGPAMPSTGCGSTMPPPPSGNQSMDVMGTKRDYIVKAPANYDANKPHKLVFAWHGLGGTAMQIAGGFGGGYYGQAQRMGDSAIYIAGQGLPTSTGMDGMEGGAGWPNTGGRDVAFVKQLVDWAKTNYCIDTSRIFSVGMSYGGIMSNTLGCQMGDVFRAIAPMSGSGPLQFGGGMCVNRVAAWLSHGNMDTVVQFASGQKSRDHWAQANHCTSMTMPTDPSPCVAYQGCDAGYPVTWCEFEGGHTVPPFASEAIFKFFSQF